MNFDTPHRTVPRDRWKRPLITPVAGGDPVAYTRATTLAGTLDDTYNLTRWKQRMTAIGIADRPDLALAIAAHREEKRRLDALVDDAMEAAGASAKATIGTAVHQLCQQSDEGTLYSDRIPVAYRPDVEAYRRATEGLEHLLIEELVVCDELAVAGTPDRVVRWRGHNYIADIKTGSLDHALGAIEIQLAIYAHSVRYDVATGIREPIPDLEADRAMVIHLPAGRGECELYWVDIAAGWAGAQLAVQARRWRSRKRRLEQLQLHPLPLGWRERIACADSVGELEEIWADAFAVGEWTPELTTAAAKRKAWFSTGLT